MVNKVASSAASITVYGDGTGDDQSHISASAHAFSPRQCPSGPLPVAGDRLQAAIMLRYGRAFARALADKSRRCLLK